jgi:hypothetical protein
LVQSTSVATQRSPKHIESENASRINNMPSTACVLFADVGIHNVGSASLYR